MPHEYFAGPTYSPPSVLARRGLAAAALTLVTLLASQDAARADDCAKAKSARAINDCMQARHKKSEQDLTAAYGQAQKELAKSANSQQKLQELRAAQERWVKSRDDDCDVDSAKSGQGGSGSNAEIWLCLSEQNRSRTNELKKLQSP